VNEDGNWVTINGRRVFIKNKDVKEELEEQIIKYTKNKKE